MSHKIYLLDKNYLRIGETNCFEANHLDKSKFVYFEIDGKVFKNNVVFIVFATLNINTGKVENKYFKIKGTEEKWSV